MPVAQRFGPNHCEACQGKECLGGGHLNCFQRDPNPSILAAIVDSYGGVRTIVTYADNLHCHVRPGELAVVSPGLELHEPIAWNDIPIVVTRSQLELDKWIEQRGIPNDPDQRECVVMYQLNLKMHPSRRGSRDITVLAYT